MFFDGDNAGRAAIKEYAPLIHQLKSEITISQVETPEQEDVNSLVQNHPGQESEILNHLIDNRSFLFSLEKPAAGELNDTKETSEEPARPAGGKIKGSSAINPLDISNPNYITWHRDELELFLIGALPLYPIDRMIVTLGIKKVNSEHPLHAMRQKINLYQDDYVEKLARKAAERMEVGTTKVHETILQFTELLERYRQEQIQALNKETGAKELSAGRIKEVQNFLDAPKLHDRTNKLIGDTGLIGEEINRMILWYVYGYRKSKSPLHVMCLGASGTGKTYLQEKVGALMPEESKKEITSMSSNAVYYFEEDELVHKILILEDLDGANEQNILYALRELMSKTTVTKDVVIKDNKGRLKTISITVNGPVCITGTTTRESLYADNADRTIMIYLDTSPEQVQAVLAYMRKKNAGKIDVYKQEEVIAFLQDVQRVLKSVKVIIPFAEDLILPTWFLKQYRTNSHYQEFIKAVTFYHQRQREIKYDSRNNPYIESTYEDIEIANKLMKDVLLAKSDELPKATRNFLDKVKGFLQESSKESFYATEIRKRYRMSPSALGRYLKKLTSYGYIKIVSGSKRKGYEYELEKNIQDRRGRLGEILDEILQKVKEKYGDNPEGKSREKRA